jgi:putative protein kinase ArgK-like GTPase of G3E family
VLCDQVSPGGGDELQGIKKGVMELADLIVVNKADGDLADAARKTQFEYQSALKLIHPKSFDWMPRVLLATHDTHDTQGTSCAPNPHLPSSPARLR